MAINAQRQEIGRGGNLLVDGTKRGEKITTNKYHKQEPLIFQMAHGDQCVEGMGRRGRHVQWKRIFRRGREYRGEKRTHMGAAAIITVSVCHDMRTKGQEKATA